MVMSVLGVEYHCTWIEHHKLSGGGHFSVNVQRCLSGMDGCSHATLLTHRTLQTPNTQRPEVRRK